MSMARAEGIFVTMAEPAPAPETKSAERLPASPKRKLPLAEPNPLGDDDEPVPPGNYPPLVDYDD
jgi:hypothetical protein